MAKHHALYHSKAWEDFREAMIGQRMIEQGEIICDYCGKSIVQKYDLILHHKHMITDANYLDSNVALNPENIMMVHHDCHEKIHAKIGRVRGTRERFVWLVYGAPCSGKSTYVQEHLQKGDLVCDIDRIWQCVSGQEMHVKPTELNQIVFQIRDSLLDMIRTRVGTWSSAWIVGGYPLKVQRESMCKRLGARPIFLDTSEEECVKRRISCNRPVSYDNYIHDWFLSAKI